MSLAWLPGESILSDEYHIPSPDAPVQPKKKKRKRANSIRKRRERLLEVDPCCKYCRLPLTLDTSTLDHVLPRSRGGLTNDFNTVLACRKCNNKKGSRVQKDDGEFWAPELAAYAG